MKTLAVMLAFVFLSISVSAQEVESSDWNIMPSVVLVKYFPSERINGPGINRLSILRLIGTRTPLIMRQRA